MSSPALALRPPDVKPPFTPKILSTSAPNTGDAIRFWLDLKISSGKWCDLTRTNVSRMAGRWIELIGQKKLRSIEVHDIEILEKARSESGIVETSMNQERAYLRQFFRWAHTHHGWMRATQDPAQNWKKRPEIVHRKYVALSQEDEGRFCSASIELKRDWLWRMVVLAIATNLRQGAIRRLTVGMVSRDVDGFAFLNVPYTIIKTKQNRRIPLSPKALAAIGPLEGRQADEILIQGIPTGDGDTVKSQICYWTKVAAKRAGIDKAFSFHDTRRTFVARLSRQNVPMHTIMILGGWKRSNTMLDHYCTIQEDEARKVFGML